MHRNGPHFWKIKKQKYEAYKIKTSIYNRLLKEQFKTLFYSFTLKFMMFASSWQQAVKSDNLTQKKDSK